jgi:penicillin G amidase
MTLTLFVRVVRKTALLLGVLLVAGLALAYWYVWRPLPQRSGAIDAPLAASATVTFDALGEPHIQAASAEDAFFVQGYVTAQDRLFQMDGLRRFASGQLSEVMGPATLKSDREARNLRMRRIAEEAYTTLPPADLAAMSAYTRGVNHFIATHREKLPVEFSLVGYEPRPWSVVDSLLLCLYMYRSLTTTWKDEVTKSGMLESGDREKVEALFPMHGLADVSPGSNGWAISGKHTASGKPLLSNDMHIEYSLPGIWYLVHLQAPGLDVAGVSLPGAPGVIVGHNQRIAWGITNLQFDVQDLYIENIDVRTGRYLFHGHMEQAHAERELIRVKGRPADELSIWVTRHGPILINESQRQEPAAVAKQGQRQLALRWTAAEPGLLQFPFLDIDRAQNWDEFTRAISRLPGPGSNFVYADVDGNIGYHAAGALPRRHGYRGDVPVDGASGNYEWEGFIPFGELPSVYNPPSGIVVSANQNTFPENFPYPVNGNFGPPYRAQRIRELLSAREGWKAEDQLAVQTDVYSPLLHYLAGQIAAAYAKRNQRNASLDAVAESLRKWNGQVERDQAAPLVASLAYLELRRTIAQKATSAKEPEYEFTMAGPVVERMLRERPAGWFADYDELLVRALSGAAEEARKTQGSDPARWRYGNYLSVTISNPVLHKVQVIGKWFEIGPIGMSGAASTVKQTTFKLEPSMRMNADLGNWDNSLLNLPIGQSGQPLSSHYRDQWEAFYQGRSFPMRYGKVDAKAKLVFTPSN